MVYRDMIGSVFDACAIVSITLHTVYHCVSDLLIVLYLR